MDEATAALAVHEPDTAIFGLRFIGNWDRLSVVNMDSTLDEPLGAFHTSGPNGYVDYYAGGS